MSDANATDPVHTGQDGPELQLYKAREKIYPKAVSGWFRRMKWWIMAVTLLIYYLTPWIRWDRGPHAPDQAVLIDMANRKFYFFFIEIWPQEFYYVAGLLIMAGVGLFLITSTVGRAWCGYFCPQTVWTDLYLHVERFIEGDRNAQIRLDRSGWTGEKLRKRVSKHAIWLLIALLTGGAWVFYFADAPTLLGDLLAGEAPFVAYATIGVLTFTTYSLGGLMREQVCTYMCPWPRIQGAMLDEDSLTITYHDWRGEPRGKHRKSAEASALGDCIDCNACVNVCPMGIDIRNGQQLECITCGLCIDACDSMMEKMGFARGLVDYATLKDYETAKATGEPVRTTWKSFIRPRTLVYAAAWSMIGLAMVAMLTVRDRLDVTVQHDRNPQFVTLSDGSIRNGYTLKILNMRLEPRIFAITLDGIPEGRMTLAGSETAPARTLRVTVPADDVKQIKLFVQRPRAAIRDDRESFDFLVEDLFRAESARYDAAFFSPEN